MVMFGLTGNFLFTNSCAINEFLKGVKIPATPRFATITNSTIGVVVKMGTAVKRGTCFDFCQSQLSAGG